MKSFKAADSAISFIIILLSVFASMASIFFLGYGLILIGAWQTVSMLIHEVTGCMIFRITRRIYHILSLLVILLFVIQPLRVSFLQSDIAQWFIIILLPCMAVFYTALCFAEYHVIIKEEEAQKK